MQASHWCAHDRDAMAWSVVDFAYTHHNDLLKPALLQVTLDEKSPTELLQLLHEVLGLLEPAQQAAGRQSEPAEVAARRLSLFLRLLKFPFPGDDACVEYRIGLASVVS